MWKTLRNLTWREAAPRLIVDLVVVHASGLLAVLAAVVLRVRGGETLTAEAIGLLLRTYYTAVFLPLSLIFPVVFLLSGFYSTSRQYLWKYKWRTVLRGSVLASLVYLFASFLATRDGTLPRSSLLVFVVMVVAGTVGTRWLKAAILYGDRSTPQAWWPQPAEAGQVLVVGGAGYIGSIVVRKLLAAGYWVRILDSLVYGNGAIREVLGHPHLELLVGDCRNIQSVVAAVKGVESILHLAAIVGDPACEQDRRAALEINFAATRMLIEVAKGNRVQRLIFASSCSVYGASDEMVDEKSCVHPISLYAHTKCDSERALLEAASESFHPTILRFATVFGHSYRPRFDLVVNLLTAQACQEGVITIYNGQQWRPFLHVDDAAAALLEVLRAPVVLVGGEVFNVGDSRLNHTLADVAGRIARYYPHTQVQRIENSDRRNYRVNFDKFRRATGFRATRDLDDGIRELQEAFRTSRITDYTDPLYHNQRFLERSGGTSSIRALDSFIMAAFSHSAAAGLETPEAEPVPR